MTKRTIYVADLRHNYGGVLSTDCMPLGAGYLKAAMDKELDADQVDVRIFAYPDDVLAAMAERAPDVMMVSNYVWNEELSLFCLRHARSLNPDVISVMGGPNIPFEPERQTAWLAAHPEVDVYVLGEGDFLAAEIVQRWLDAGCSRDALREQEIPSTLQHRPSGEVARTEQAGRQKDVDEIPSPWLTGIMDQFFDGKMAPIIETNRGCPFACSYCVQGTKYYSRVTKFDMGRLEQEIDYVGRAIHERSPEMTTLRIADANYGMYDRDVEISEMIGKAQVKYDWPKFIDATTGKNRADNIIKSMEKVNGALVLYQAVQSLDEDVLRNIRRSNIKLDTYEQMQIHVRGRGLRSTSDLILGLPGESLTSHITALHKLIDTGTSQAHCFQAMMLKGSELETTETRARFRFDTRFRVLPKNFGIYAGEKVFDIEEVVVATDTLPFDDYLECRTHHLTFSVFWNDSWFEALVQFAQQRFGVKPSEWLNAMKNAMEQADGTVRQFLDDFLGETKGELFPTREACRDHYAQPEVFEKLKRGEVGDNLMYKYRAKASFFIWREVCALAVEATRGLLAARGAHDQVPQLDAFLDDLGRYIEAQHAHGANEQEVLAPASVELRWDLPRWVADGYPAELGAYALEQPTRYELRLDPEGAAELAAAMKVWTMNLAGLAKLVTRIRITSQVRQPQVEHAASA